MKEVSTFKENDYEAYVYRDSSNAYYVEYFKGSVNMKYKEFNSLQEAEDSAEDWVLLGSIPW